MTHQLLRTVNSSSHGSSWQQISLSLSIQTEITGAVDFLFISYGLEYRFWMSNGRTSANLHLETHCNLIDANHLSAWINTLNSLPYEISNTYFAFWNITPVWIAYRALVYSYPAQLNCERHTSRASFHWIFHGEIHFSHTARCLHASRVCNERKLWRFSMAGQLYTYSTW